MYDQNCIKSVKKLTFIPFGNYCKSVEIFASSVHSYQLFWSYRRQKKQIPFQSTSTSNYNRYCSLSFYRWINYQSADWKATCERLFMIYASKNSCSDVIFPLYRELTTLPFWWNFEAFPRAITAFMCLSSYWLANERAGILAVIVKLLLYHFHY